MQLKEAAFFAVWTQQLLRKYNTNVYTICLLIMFILLAHEVCKQLSCFDCWWALKLESAQYRDVNINSYVYKPDFITFLHF